MLDGLQERGEYTSQANEIREGLWGNGKRNLNQEQGKSATFFPPRRGISLSVCSSELIRETNPTLVGPFSGPRKEIRKTNAKEDEDGE